MGDVLHEPWGAVLVRERPRSVTPAPGVPLAEGLRPARGALVGLALGLALWALIGVAVVQLVTH